MGIIEYDIYIFGDSHAKCFFRHKDLSFDNIRITINPLSSASMKGLTNSKSTLDHKNKIINTLNDLNPLLQNICILKFGQVDIEYNYYFKIYNKGESINKEKFYKDLIENYMVFIKHLKLQFPNVKFIINGVNMPNVYDLQKYMQISTPNMPHINYNDQFNNHSNFNLKLEDECKKYKVPYFDLTQETTHNKLLKPSFIGKDNHLSGAEHPDVLNGESGENYNTYNTFLGKLLKTIENNA